jgi:hydrogenase maturation protease
VLNEIETANRRVVLGLGNVLYGDEGFGIHALHNLSAHFPEYPGIEWVDGGVLGLDLLPLVESCSHLLVLDALNADQPAGTVVELKKDQIPLYHGVKLSEHQLGFQEVLALAAFRGRLPENLSLIGVQPARLEVGTHLSPKVTEAIPRVRRLASHVLRDWD